MFRIGSDGAEGKCLGVVGSGDRIAVIAGPCAVESRERALAIAREVKRQGGLLFRGGAFKPRTSPKAFYKRLKIG